MPISQRTAIPSIVREINWPNNQVVVGIGIQQNASKQKKTINFASFRILTLRQQPLTVGNRQQQASNRADNSVSAQKKYRTQHSQRYHLAG